MSDIVQDDIQEDDAPQVGTQPAGATVSDEDIRKMLDDERRARREVEVQLQQERTERNRAQAQANTAHVSRFEAEEQAVKSRLDAADTEAKALRRALSEALAEGRFDDVAEVQDQIAELRAKQLQDRNYQAYLAVQKTQAQQAPAPVNDGIDLSQYTPAQRKWIKQNPDFMTDAKIRARTFAGHQIAVADGIEVDTPEYFQIIDNTVFGKHRQVETDDDDPPPPPRRRPEPSAEIPVTRRTSEAPAERGTKSVRLSAEQMEAADITLPDVPVQGYKDPSGQWVPGRYERYYRNVQKLSQRGGR